ncbi:MULTISPECIES: DNA transfer protein [Enterobacteriaceae]|uniref:DNA transfer protein n=1 Tax=Enterobacteriaceae TaxID=543 RepID=UPI000B95520F|nr:MULTISPECIES: DNA transfer protein [Enterobacteriaceae]EKQ5199381.1 DNA transfer protein [Escherichia coli]ELS8087526.1 DNA transfer protein [Escherichia coli]MDC6751040.1 DNA transfer protein [Escherichia coli]MDC6919066.1 DNA transfer protein [Escherichia coli]MDC6977574.1 DNA transfer protein [Escherichia coli]
MATWQQGINSGGFLAGIGAQNENAPKASDINATLGLIRENNELARSGANNVGLTALRGLAGVADIYKQEQQQKAISAFNKVHADAWASGDPSGLFKFAQENPAFVAQAQQAFSGLNDQQRNDMGDLAMRANVALSQGPEAYSKFITDNKDRLNRVGANADWMIQTGIQNPEQLSHMLTTMSLGALGPEKAFAVQDKMAGREIDRGMLAETIRSNRASEALQARGQDISRANALTSAYAPTAAMQNYNQYAQMLKADPDGAAAFAAAAGINPNAKKLLKVETNPDGSVTKYYTDGSEEAGKLNQPISGDGIKPISLPQAQSIIDKANEGSKKAAGFALRLKDSMDSMNQLSKSIDPKRVALINRSLGDGTIANLSLSPAEQQYMVNARDALYAILRPETGAAITLPEMQEYSKMYLPQPGDSKAATETKMRKMQGQYNSLRGQSGRVYDALVVSSAANSQQQSNSQQPTNTQQQQSQSGSYTSKSGIQFTVE